MSYIGNYKTPLIFGPNTKDDIVPDGTTSVFTLSQEVPGAWEANIMVLRRKIISDQLVENTTSLIFDETTDQIQVTADASLAAALSVVRVGDFIEIEGTVTPTSPVNAGIYSVLSSKYDGTTVTIQLAENLDAGDSNDPSIRLKHLYYTPWETLEPEIDYVISGTGAQYNRQIEFVGGAPKENERIYVLHRGEATYNFVPSARTVGPDQLQENLRNFVVDRHVGDALEVNFLLSQEAIDSKSLLVTLDGVITDGDSLGYTAGSWQLTESIPVSGVFDQITFDVAPALGVEIRILHLGFSTISRRAIYSPNQSTLVVPPNSVGSVELQSASVDTIHLVDGAVTPSKLSGDAVSGANFLLQNNQAIRAEDNLSVEHDILKVDTSNDLILSVPSSGSELKINATVIPDSPVALGSVTNPFSDIFADGQVAIGSQITLDTGVITGDIINADTINVTGTVDGVDVSDLYDQVQNIALGFPAGGVIPFAGSNVVTSPPGWLFCDGSAYDVSTYPTLFSVIGYTYGGSGSTFRVPDLRLRFPLGRNSVSPANALGNTGGDFNHVHEIPDHTHDDVHTHVVPAHYHQHDVSLGTDLAITTPSGGHNTSLSHTHTATIAASGAHEHTLGIPGQFLPEQRSVYASSENLPASVYGVQRNPAHEHTIGGLTGEDTPNHTHTADTPTGTENDPTLSHHTHTVKTVGIQDAGTYLGTDPHFVVATPAANPSTEDINDGTDGEHTHDFTVVTTIPSTEHQHSVSITTASSGSHDHVIRGTVPDTDSAHTHAVTINPTSTLSPSNGEHIHPTGSFSGGIGNKSGVNGNQNITTGARSTPTTGQVSSPGPGTTFEANPPYIVLSYIIKT